MSNFLARLAREEGEVPLGWAGATQEMDYLNFGDALSPVMVALMSGLRIRRVPMRSHAVRMGCVGTVGHAFGLGEAWFWGTGCSNRAGGAAAAEKRPFVPPDGSRFVICATRGPVSELLLSRRTLSGAVPYGDPVWLLPRFYRPKVKKRYRLGVILHLSELADRALEAHPLPNLTRLAVPASLAGDVHLITTVTGLAVADLRAKIDEILSCERIVSTSLHGMVVAESYGIPCLYFAPNVSEPGPRSLHLAPDGDVDLRIVDLYTGLGLSHLDAYGQPRTQATDWEAVIAAVDRAWAPKEFDADALIDAFPLDLKPVRARRGSTVWEHPALTGIQFRHEVIELGNADRKENPKPGGPDAWPDAFVVTTPEAAPRPRRKNPDAAALLARIRSEGEPATVPLSWAASARDFPFANLGDALSAVLVAGLAGLPVRHAAFDQDSERLVGVGTIGHAQVNGTVHFWGTGLDATRDAGGAAGAYRRPPGTEFRVHAVRGPNTAAVLRAQGIAVPDIYGDPVYLLPKLWPMDHVEKTHEIGVIIHLTEMAERTPESGARADLARYGLPEGRGGIRIINTVTERDTASLRRKVEEILSCRVILSTSLHGLVIAESYGIPCAWFATWGGGAGRQLDLADPDTKIDHRMRDFYLGAGATHLNAYCQRRDLPTDWDRASHWVRRRWEPLEYRAKPLFDAFPLPTALHFYDEDWPVAPGILDATRY